MSINERVREVRQSLNLSMENFGSRIGVTRSAISRIESGIVSVTAQVQTSIIREFNVNEEWLLNGTGEMFNELTTSELAAKLVGQIITSKDEFVINTLIAVASLKPEQWDSIKEFVEKLKGE